MILLFGVMLYFQDLDRPPFPIATRRSLMALLCWPGGGCHGSMRTLIEVMGISVNDDYADFHVRTWVTPTA